MTADGCGFAKLEVSGEQSPQGIQLIFLRKTFGADLLILETARFLSALFLSSWFHSSRPRWPAATSRPLNRFWRISKPGGKHFSSASVLPATALPTLCFLTPSWWRIALPHVPGAHGSSRANDAKWYKRRSEWRWQEGRGKRREHGWRWKSADTNDGRADDSSC